MISFQEFVTESQGANKHLEHIEDEILNNGFDGVRKSIVYLSSIAKTLKGSSKSKITITTKWDGAPAIVAGKDPETGKFFIATKHGAFAKEPKLNFTNEDIDNNHGEGDLNDKLKNSLKYLSELNMDGVYQGDLLFSLPYHKKIEVIEDEKHIVFKPNTITYAIPLNSDLGKIVNYAKIGVVWHTKYDGEKVNEMNASFDVDISNFKSSKDVWFKDAEYEKMDGVANFTQEESERFFLILSEAGKLFRKLDKEILNQIAKDKDINLQIKAFNNQKIMQGMPIGNTRKHVKEMVRYLEKKLNDQVSKLKSEKGRQKRKEKNDTFLSFFKNNSLKLKNIFEMQNLLIAAKMLVIKKLQDMKPLTKTFIQTINGYKVTNPEGFVAVTTDNGAVKLIDRLEFTRQNFMATKTFGSK